MVPEAAGASAQRRESTSAAWRDQRPCAPDRHPVQSCRAGRVEHRMVDVACGGRTAMDRQMYRIGDGVKLLASG